MSNNPTPTAPARWTAPAAGCAERNRPACESCGLLLRLLLLVFDRAGKLQRVSRDPVAGLNPGQNLLISAGCGQGLYLGTAEPLWSLLNKHPIAVLQAQDGADRNGHAILVTRRYEDYSRKHVGPHQPVRVGEIYAN